MKKKTETIKEWERDWNRERNRDRDNKIVREREKWG